MDTSSVFYQEENGSLLPVRVRVSNFNIQDHEILIIMISQI